MAALGSTRFGAATSTVLLSAIKGAPVSGRLLGASPKGIYFGFDHDRKPGETPCVVAILPVSSVRLPLAMVTTSPLPAITPGDPVVAGDGALTVGHHSWHPVRWFDPRPTRLRLPAAAALAAASEALWNLDDGEVGVPLIQAWRAATALASGDAHACHELLGAGPGLTPAGDDVVAGALAACALYGSHPLTHAADSLIGRACLATTTLSAALLSCAGSGQVVPQAEELLRALGKGEGIAPALAHLRAVGATSGTALAVGLVAALTVVTSTAAAQPPAELPAQLHPQPHAPGAPGGSADATERPQPWAVAP